MASRGAAHPPRWVRRTLIALAVSSPAAPVSAGVIRHDRDDADYRALAELPQFQAVGQVRAMVNGSSRLCSGTLIAPDWVLTAGHCVDGVETDSIEFRNAGQSLYASQIVVHPQFDGSVGPANDVGLIQLASPSASLAPAQRTRDSIPLGGVTTIVGYGLTGDGNTGAVSGTYGTKRAGKNIVDMNGSHVIGANGRPYPDYMVFADFDNPNKVSDNAWGSAAPQSLEYQAAAGDSGAGWFVNQNGVERLLAVHSIGLAFDGALDNDYGDVGGATRVTRFNAWIDEQLGADYWINPLGGAFGDAVNWSDAAPPPSDRPLRFAFPTGYPISVTGAQNAESLQVECGVVTFNLQQAEMRIHELQVAAGAVTYFVLGANDSVEIDGPISGTGEVYKNGAGELRFTGATSFNGSLDFNSGKMVIAEGAVATFNQLRVGAFGPLAIEIAADAHLATGEPLAFATRAALRVDSGGTLNVPALSQDGEITLDGGRMLIDGALTQTTGAVTSIDLTRIVFADGPAAIQAGAESQLAGTLRLSLSGELPTDPNQAILAQQEWTILTAESALAGKFDSVDWGDLPDGFEFTLNYATNSVSVELQRLPHSLLWQPGDTNGDQQVDLLDLNNVRNHFASSHGLGDTNGDDVIDLVDLNAVRNHFGERYVATTSNVPEPASGLLAIMLIAAAAGCRSRH